MVIHFGLHRGVSYTNYYFCTTPVLREDSCPVCFLGYLLIAVYLHFQFVGDVFEFVQCLDTGADKDEALLPYKDSGLIWIEDKPENAKLGADFGLKTFMLRHAHNATFNYDGVTNVDNWTQIVNSFE